MVKFKKVPTHLGPRQLLADAAQRVRPAVPRDPDHGQRRRRSSARSPRRSCRRSESAWHDPRWPRASSRGHRGPRHGDEPPCLDHARHESRAAGNSAGALRLALVRGRAGARRRHARAATARGRGPDRPERRGQVDAREPDDRVRPAHVGRVELDGREITELEPAPPRRAPGSRARSSTRSRSATSRCARTSRSPRSASAPGRARRAGAPTSCCRCSASTAQASTCRRARWRTATSGASASRGRSRWSRASC